MSVIKEEAAYELFCKSHDGMWSARDLFYGGYQAGLAQVNEVKHECNEKSQVQQPYDHDLGSVLVALENAISELKGIIYTENLKAYVAAKDKLASFLQSQAQQKATKPLDRTIESAKEAFESSSIFTRYYSDEQAYSNCRYENESLNSSFVDFCEGYFSSPPQAQQEPVIYFNNAGELVSRVSIEQVDVLLSNALRKIKPPSQAQHPSEEFRTSALQELYAFQEATGCDIAAELKPHQLSQAQQSQWISVDERLPEMAQKVFGIYDAGMCAFMRVRSEDDTWCWAIGRNDLYDDFFYDADDDYQITHWMALPPAPEGGDQ